MERITSGVFHSQWAHHTEACGAWGQLKGKQVMFYMKDDDNRLLEMLEASGEITNRSAWLSAIVQGAAQKANVRQAVKQAIERKRAELVELEALDAQADKIELDKDLLWEKLTTGFWARYSWHKAPTHQQNRYWLDTRKKVIAMCRPGLSVDQVIEQLESEGKDHGKTRVLAQDTRRQAP